MGILELVLVVATPMLEDEDELEDVVGGGACWGVSGCSVVVGWGWSVVVGGGAWVVVGCG